MSSSLSDFPISPDLLVHCFSRPGVSVPLFILREWDSKVIRTIGHKPRCKGPNNEQALRACVRQGVLSMNLHLEPASKDEIQILKSVGILGKRAPSGSLISAPDLVKLLEYFSKGDTVEALKKALEARQISCPTSEALEGPKFRVNTAEAPLGSQGRPPSSAAAIEKIWKTKKKRKLVKKEGGKKKKARRGDSDESSGESSASEDSGDSLSESSEASSSSGISAPAFPNNARGFSDPSKLSEPSGILSLPASAPLNFPSPSSKIPSSLRIRTNGPPAKLPALSPVSPNAGLYINSLFLQSPTQVKKPSSSTASAAASAVVAAAAAASSAAFAIPALPSTLSAQSFSGLLQPSGSLSSLLPAPANGSSASLASAQSSAQAVAQTVANGGLTMLLSALEGKPSEKFHNAALERVQNLKKNASFENLRSGLQRSSGVLNHPNLTVAIPQQPGHSAVSSMLSPPASSPNTPNPRVAAPIPAMSPVPLLGQSLGSFGANLDDYEALADEEALRINSSIGSFNGLMKSSSSGNLLNGGLSTPGMAMRSTASLGSSASLISLGNKIPRSPSSLAAPPSCWSPSPSLTMPPPSN